MNFVAKWREEGVSGVWKSEIGGGRWRRKEDGG